MTPLYVRPVDSTQYCTLVRVGPHGLVTACLERLTGDVAVTPERPELKDQCPACRRHAEAKRRGMRSTRDLKRRAAA